MTKPIKCKSRLQQRQHYGNFRRSFRKANKTQIRIAETEKYPHVTFFFFPVDEKSLSLVKSRIQKTPKVATRFTVKVPLINRCLNSELEQ
jgi:bisphosphoglycerate-independent phosphoglycerate mutase (AlkP superfamily)